MLFGLIKIYDSLSSNKMSIIINVCFLIRNIRFIDDRLYRLGLEFYAFYFYKPAFEINEGKC